jgi:hypothetical protein
VVCICQQFAEFWFIDSVEGLISGNDPLCQQVLKRFLIPWALNNINAPKIWAQIHIVHVLL